MLRCAAAEGAPQPKHAPLISLLLGLQNQKSAPLNERRRQEWGALKCNVENAEGESTQSINGSKPWRQQGGKEALQRM